jgi:hypothetical protein
MLLIAATPVIRANRPEFMFKLISSSGSSAVLAPVLPAQIRVMKLEGENPTTTFFSCEIIERRESDVTRHLLKCGTAIYDINGYLFSN